MARTVTLTTMIARVRSETDQQYDTVVVSAPAFTDATITDYINEGIAKIAQVLVAIAPDRMRTATTISVVSGTEDYALPSGFQAVRGVDYPIGSTYATVHPFAFEERNELQAPWPFSPTGGAPFKYHVYGNGVSGSSARITFRPVPTASATVRLHYVGVPAALTSGADTFDGIIGLESYAVSYAKSKIFARTRQTDGYAEAMAEMAQCIEDIKLEAGRRDRSGLEVVARVVDYGGSRHFNPFR
jgi:hypothetical protein